MDADADTTRPRQLYGRDAELAALTAVCEQARRGQCGAMLLTGAAGVGKSVLLEHALRGQHGFRVLRTCGVTAEATLAYAGLHRLLGSEMHRMQRLPPAYRTALSAALDGSPIEQDQRRVLGMGVRTLFTEIAADDPVLLCVDDLQTMDEPSARTLEFVLRRLDACAAPEAAGGVAFLGAFRTDDGAYPPPGIAACELGCLDAADSAALLEDVSPGPVAAHVATSIATGTGGNPLALTELANLLSADQRSGREPLSDPLAVGMRTASAYTARTGTLTAESRQFLVLIAAEETGDLALLARAAEEMNLSADVFDTADSSGLVTFGSSGARFRNPLERSALYHGASRRTRRFAHEAIAAALTEPDDADRRAWHRAATEFGANEQLAGELERAAPRARQRGGYPAGARVLERAGWLSPEQHERCRRFVAAAQDECAAGRTQHALWLADNAEHAHPDEFTSATVARLRAELQLRGGSVLDAYAALRKVGHSAGTAPGEALRALASAGEAAAYAGDAGKLWQAYEHAMRIESAAEEPSDRVLLDILRGSAEVLSGSPASGTGYLRRALASAEHSTEPRTVARLAAAATLAGDDARAHVLADRAVELARGAGATATVPHALEYLVGSELFRGAYESAEARALEGIRIAEETGQLNSGCVLRADLALIAAFRGDERACGTHAALALRTATAHGLGLPAAMATWALGVIDLGMSRIPAAVQRFADLKGAGPGAGHPMVVLLCMPHWVEALVRHEPPDLTSAQRVAANFGGWAAQADQPWALALSERCAALLAEDDEADQHYNLALRLHGRSGRPFDRARTELLYGEFLRRQRHRVQAKVQLRSAWETFERLGSQLWEQRARGELRACGETVTANGHDTPEPNLLTPQELRIARLVAGGATNREVAAQLYVSPRTVDYHLRKVFHRLGISSRVELARIDVLGPHA